MTSTELGTRKLNEFLHVNGAEGNFNKSQKVILVASEFDEQTLSAVAWLNSNGVNMSCYKLIPYKINNEIYINVEQILPLSDYNEYYVDFLEKTSSLKKPGKKLTRRILPKIDTLLEWGVVREGDTIMAKDRNEEATLLKNGNVLVEGVESSMQKWLKELYGWSSIQTYVFAIHKDSRKSLSKIREEYMDARTEESE